MNGALSVLLYPDWRIRVYHDTAPGSARRARLAAAACRYRHVDLCYVSPADGDSRGEQTLERRRSTGGAGRWVTERNRVAMDCPSRTAVSG